MADFPDRISEVRRRALAVVVAAVLAAPLSAAASQDADQKRSKKPIPPAGQEATKALIRHLGATEDTATLMLVRSTEGSAVVRFGAGPLLLIAVGDRLGRHKAEVKEIDHGGMLLDESFAGPDGRPNRAQIILKDGERGGTRYLSRPVESEPLAVRPRAIDPKAKPGGY